MSTLACALEQAFQFFLNMQEVECNPTVSVPLTIGIGLLVNNRFGIHLNGIFLFVDQLYLYGIYGAFSGEYHFFRDSKEAIDLYALLGLGFGGEILKTNCDIYEEMRLSRSFTINVGGGINLSVNDWLKFGFEPRLRIGIPEYVEFPSLELLVTTNMIW